MMEHQTRKALTSHDPLNVALRQFVHREDGVMTALACFIIIMMILVGGIGVDLMRNEMERVRVQNTVDRAVLAAADLDQTLDPTAVVMDYFQKAGVKDYLTAVTVDEGLNYRNVFVDADSSTPTRFMRFMGVDTLPVPTKAAAEERVAKVEISLVLDISGSMKNNDKMVNLQSAANTFVDTVIQPATNNRISLTLVPYSEHVNAGPDLMNRLNVSTRHNFSHCVEFDDADFSSVVLNRTKWYAQAQHYQWNNYGSNSLTDTVCPRYSYERIVPFSQNAIQLKNQINQLVPRAGTSIFIGMKWAVGLLDPDFTSITNDLATSGIVDSNFADRPTAYDDIETLKTVILMTDGKNSNSNRISSSYYNSDSEVVHWANYNFNWWLSSKGIWGDNRKLYSFMKYTDTIGDQLLYNVCDAAKAKSIVIWSIGFEVDDHGADVMRNCASTPSHFFRVEGVEIADAFKAIARQITQLRLTQ